MVVSIRCARTTLIFVLACHFLYSPVASSALPEFLPVMSAPLSVRIFLLPRRAAASASPPCSDT
jgi:hypothetical protein